MRLTANICGFWLVLLTLGCGGCQVQTNSKDKSMHQEDISKHKFTNALIHESSPYLLQHAHNPVNWYPWNEETLQKAKDENKMILISIGYAACHWCHVMEEESFEDTAVANIMNKNFICIKVDREERPDIDQIYMNAVQLISGRGGWPLNCFALPDGRPFYGGTYFPKKQWIKLMEGLLEVYEKESSKIYDNAEKLTAAVQQSDVIQRIKGPEKLQIDILEAAVGEWKKSWDTFEGGPNRAPKFPIPNNFQFLQRYGYLQKDQAALDYVSLTLKKMAYGGIYDQIGGGFARYSTDEKWKVPHFEKMLYDNAQLVSLYSEAHSLNPEPLYKKTVEQTLEFIERELTSSEGAFFSSLDADSEGEEGKFYVWTKEELAEILGEDLTIFSTYYALDNRGLWENGNYILMRNELNKQDFQKLELTEMELEEKVQNLNRRLLKERVKRPAPALDDKTLTSWNALMAKAYLDAYGEFGNKEYLEKGRNSLSFILEKMKRKDEGLYHNYKSGKSSINGYLEDYCFTMEALIAMYELTFEEYWLQEADKLMSYCIKNFFDEASGMFYFTSVLDPGLIARKMEINDNVIPASNSSMAKSLFLLGNYYYQKDYLEKADVMLRNVYERIPTYASGYSNWGMLALNRIFPFFEIAISGNESLNLAKEFRKHYNPNKILIGSKAESKLPLLESKYFKDETFIYVCVEKACQMPVQSVDEALLQISGH